MRPTLLVTNDWPPVIGGIQTYLAEYVQRLDDPELMVLASTPADRDAVADDDAKRLASSAGTRVTRYPVRTLLPTVGVRRAMQRLIKEHGIETVWFGAAAPLGLLGDAARKAGATRVIATTHGHEVGWAKAPVARQLLRRVFGMADVVTYISQYTRDRLMPLIPNTTATLRLPSGIDVEQFAPNPRARTRLRQRYGIGQAPTVVCVSRLVPRKGQDALIRVWPEVAAQVPGARLVIVGWGPYAKTLAQLRRESPVRNLITLTGKVPGDELSAHVAMGDLFAMPCRTRMGGADVEGLGIVFLEAQAAGLPVVAGDSGGAPETVKNGATGLVVDGRDLDELRDAVVMYLSDRELRTEHGAAAREAMSAWSWEELTESLRTAINTRDENQPAR